MSSCTAARISIAAPSPYQTDKSVIRYEPVPGARPAVPPRARRRGWAGPTVA